MRTLTLLLSLSLFAVGPLFAADKYPLFRSAEVRADTALTDTSPEHPGQGLENVPDDSEVIEASDSASPPAATVVNAPQPARSTPLIAVIIDDLGNQRIPGERTIALHGPVACAIMPHTAHARYLAERAFAAGKEVMLHLPMQPVDMQRLAGPGEISLDTRQSDLTRILQTDLDSVPHTVGINNHMGSLITRHPGHMRWLMEELSRRGNLFFVDSYTTPDSIAYEIALEKGVPAARRHVFLDNEETEAHIARQFERLKQQARRQGYAIAIGHPYSVTLNYLEAALPQLAADGFRHVSITTLIELSETQPQQSTAGLIHSDQSVTADADLL